MIRFKQIFWRLSFLFVFLVIGYVTRAAWFSHKKNITKLFKLEGNLPNLYGILVVLLLFVVFFIVFYLTKYEIKTRTFVVFSCLLFVFMGIVYGFLANNIVIFPRTDSHTILDYALILANNRQSILPENDSYLVYMGKYPNNHLLTYVFYKYYKALSISGGIEALKTAYIFNAACLFAGAFFAWLSILISKGKASALRLLTFWVLNPIFCISVFWVYSNTISIPFSMALILLSVLILKTEGPKRVALILLYAVLFAFSFLIRPTAIFPSIAFFIYIILSTGVLRLFKIKKITLILLFLAVSFTTYKCVSKGSSSVFENTDTRAYPFSHWIMMGSHNLGKYNSKDDEFTLKNNTDDSYVSKSLRIADDNYREMGIKGTAIYWMKKVNILYSNGSFNTSFRLDQIYSYSRYYKYIAKKTNYAVSVYYNAYWLCILILVLIKILLCLSSKDCELLDFINVIVILGGIVFYSIWEVKSDYGTPFIPIFLLLASDKALPWGIRPISSDRTPAGKIAVIRYVIPILYLCFALVLFAKGLTLSNNKKVFNIKTWHTTSSITLENNDYLEQSFYPAFWFNKLEIKTLGEKKSSEDFYKVEIRNSERDVLYSEIFDSSVVNKKKKIRLNFDTLPPDTEKGYVIYIKYYKLDGDIRKLAIKHDYFLDSYEGQLYKNGETYGYPGNDLSIQVYYR